MPVNPSPNTDLPLVFRANRRIFILPLLLALVSSGLVGWLFVALLQKQAQAVVPIMRAYPPMGLIVSYVAVSSVITTGTSLYRLFRPLPLLQVDTKGITVFRPRHWLRMGGLSSQTNCVEWENIKRLVAQKHPESGCWQLTIERYQEQLPQHPTRRKAFSPGESRHDDLSYTSLVFSLLANTPHAVMTRLHAYADTHGLAGKVKTGSLVVIEMPLPPQG